MLFDAIMKGLAEGDSTFEFLPPYVKKARADRVEASVKAYIAQVFLAEIEKSCSDAEIALIKARHALIGNDHGSV